MPPSARRESAARRRLATFACALAGALLIAAVPAGATDTGSLQEKVDAARSQATALAADLRATQGQLFAAQGEAAAAAAREQQLSELLAEGQERAAELADQVARAEAELAEAKQRLRRARALLAARLVAIYKSGVPDAAAVVLGSESFGSLATQSEYLGAIEHSDSDLAARVEQVRDQVRGALAAVTELKARVDAYNERLAAARSQISAVRAAAEASAARLSSLAAAHQSQLATLQSNIGGWEADIRSAQAAAASSGDPGAEVERWLGGPFSIPSDIVMCESGGNYGAVNPSSGAGGAYQILPSTWELYGGEGAPQDAPKAEQDRIAAQIWADSGAGAWVCAGG
jgi:septal ring factor EnvC (AmiA/AmiB activator)